MPSFGEDEGDVPREGRKTARADASKPWRTKRQQFGLRHLMILSVPLAVIFAASARAYRTGSDTDVILAVVVTGAAVFSLGVYLTQRLGRFGWLGWMFVCLGPVGATVALVVASAGSIGSATDDDYWAWLGISSVVFELPVLLGVVFFLIGRRRKAEQETLLWVLALAADRQRPLGPAVAALAEQTNGVYQLRARHLAECLDQGMPLPEALDFVTHSVPATAKVLTRVGAESGALAEALKDAASGRSASPPGWHTFGSKVGYLCLVFVFLQAVLGYLLYSVTPKIEAIFRDFSVELPQITIAISGLSRWAASGLAMPILALLEGFLLIYLPFAFSGFANLHVPFLDRLFLRRHSVLVLRCLAMTVGGNRPIGQGLQILARSYPTGWVRERLLGAYLATSQGHDWIEALRYFALITRGDVALLESSRRAGNLPWALRELAEGTARKLGYRLQAMSQVMLTTALLAIGVMVGVVAVAYFYPVVKLIERLI
jgi:type II secretory pathway component PulF